MPEGLASIERVVRQGLLAAVLLIQPDLPAEERQQKVDTLLCAMSADDIIATFEESQA